VVSESMSYHDIRVEELSTFIAVYQPVILDMRDPLAYEKGHIEGAVPADEAHIRKLLTQKEQPVLICCYHGHSSRELASFLCQMGLKHVYNLEGGWHELAGHMSRQSACPSTPPSKHLQQWLQQHGFRHTDSATQLIHARIDKAMSALMVAAMDGDLAIVKELIEMGADMHAENNDGNQPLWFAAASGNTAMLKLLLQAGADADHINFNGYTTLMFAASTGKLAVVETLLAAGANSTIINPDGLNALECAATLPVLKRLKAECRTH